MKARFGATVILLVFLCVTLCGCGAFFNSPFNSLLLENQPVETFRLYVYGAVLNEGYVEVEAGSAYDDAIRLAGLLSESILPSYAAATVDGSITRIAINYYDGAVERECVNVNSALIVGRFHVDGIPDEIVNKLADYIQQYGKITNKEILLTILGDDYSANFYKFFVSEEDYEKAD